MTLPRLAPCPGGVHTNVCYLCRQRTPFCRTPEDGNICKACWVLRHRLFHKLADTRVTKSRGTQSG